MEPKKEREEVELAAFVKMTNTELKERMRIEECKRRQEVAGFRSIRKLIPSYWICIQERVGILFPCLAVKKKELKRGERMREMGRIARLDAPVNISWRKILFLCYSLSPSLFLNRCCVL